MTDTLRLHERVRVRRLLRAEAEYDGWGKNHRPPAVGDVGYLIDVLHAPGQADRFVVECAGPDGTDVWLSDFTEEEIEPVPGEGS